MSKHGLRDEDGQVLALVAVFMPVLIVVLVLAIDPAGWWTHKRHLQLQADAAALAGGAWFTNCFTDGNDAQMRTHADSYVGLPALSSTFNVTDMNKGTLGRYYNSATFPYQGAATGTWDSCSNGRFNVKVSESGLNSILSGITATRAAEAEVAIGKATGGNPDMGLAVPDVNPSDVTATFASQTGTTCSPSCTVHLTKQGISGGYVFWSNAGSPITLNVPDAYDNVGLRVGVGSNITSPCGASLPEPRSYLCYDDNGSTQLALIRGFPTSGTAAPANPIERAAWMTLDPSCGINATTSFMSDASGQTTCSGTLYVQIDWGGAAGPAPHCTGNMNAGQEVCISVGGNEMTPPAGTSTGVWTLAVPNIQSQVDTGGAVYGPPGGDRVQWSNGPVHTCGNNGKQPCTGQDMPGVNGSAPNNVTPLQQIYSSDSGFDAGGPLMKISLSESGSPATGSPYSLAAGSHALTVSVGLSLDFGDQPTGAASPETLLRFQVNHSASRTALVNCGANFPLNVTKRCPQQYVLNTRNEVCTPTLNPPDCVTTSNGAKASIDNFLGQRFSNCPTNYWPNYDTVNPDPRKLQLIVTDFIKLVGNGQTDVPVTHLGTFYVDGWSGGSSCSQNTPGPPNAAAKGDIWGHFIKYADPGDIGPPDPSCLTSPSPDACSVKLTK
jgi:hypothetical protein